MVRYPLAARQTGQIVGFDLLADYHHRHRCCRRHLVVDSRKYSSLSRVCQVYRLFAVSLSIMDDAGASQATGCLVLIVGVPASKLAGDSLLAWQIN